MDPTQDAPHVSIYSVGLLHDLRVFRSGSGRPDARRRLLRALLYPVRQGRAGNWRAVKNYFNGYLAEHETLGTRAGTGWTRGRAYRDLLQHLAAGR